MCSCPHAGRDASNPSGKDSPRTWAQSAGPGRVPGRGRLGQAAARPPGAGPGRGLASGRATRIWPSLGPRDRNWGPGSGTLDHGRGPQPGLIVICLAIRVRGRLLAPSLPPPTARTIASAATTTGARGPYRGRGCSAPPEGGVCDHPVRRAPTGHIAGVHSRLPPRNRRGGGRSCCHGRRAVARSRRRGWRGCGWVGRRGDWALWPAALAPAVSGATLPLAPAVDAA